MKKFKSFVVIGIIGLMLCASIPTVFAMVPIVPVATGALMIKSAPSGAHVYVDGELVPLETSINPIANGCVIKNLTIGSSYLIKVEKAGFVPVTKIFKIKGSFQGYTFVLKPLPNIAVVSFPLGATLYVNGQKWAATTPCIIPSVSPGKSYILRVEKTGYLPVEKKITAINGTKYVGFNLPRYKDAQVSIKSTPSGAAIYVNGNFVGTTPYVITIPSSQVVSFKIEKAGYITQTKAGYFSNGEKYLWMARLKTSIIPK